VPQPLDFLIVIVVSAALAAGALRFEPYPLDAFRDQWRLFAALLALVGVAYSWVSTMLGAGVRTLAGEVPSPVRAFVRALLAVGSAALCGFGFILAIFDRRHQTLHDKLCGCVVDRPRG